MYIKTDIIFNFSLSYDQFIITISIVDIKLMARPLCIYNTPCSSWLVPTRLLLLLWVVDKLTSRSFLAKVITPTTSKDTKVVVVLTKHLLYGWVCSL